MTTKLKIVLILIAVLGLGAVGSYFYFQNSQPPQPQKDIYLRFLSEIYHKIQQNYWKKMTEKELCNLFKLGTEKLTGAPQPLSPKTKPELEKMLAGIMQNMDGKGKQEFSTQLANLVLVNLKPKNRSGLYTQKQKKQLQERVKNVNPKTGEVEPTIISKLVRPDVFYVRIKKISPQTFDEFKKAAEAVKSEPSSLILDLRGNVGGSFDILPYFLGPFIGKNQYAFELFQQGEYQPYKTQTGWLPSLVKYKKVIILIDSKTQSSAEVMASTLKRYNVGVVVGTKTKGWGTIEKVFEIKNKVDPNKEYSMFLVHHLAVGDLGQPIEGRGVSPTINIKDPDWEDQLLKYFNYPELIKAIKQVQ